MRSPALSFAAACAAIATLSSPASEACAPAPRAGEVVRITDEAALIVWDPATKTEHFIRSAAFATTAKDFGFLVPTPTRPQLAEADGDMIPELMRRTQAERVRETRGVSIEPGCTAMMFFARSASAPDGQAPASVRVLDERRVAGYDAVVLEADGAADLSDWLKRHGYAEGPALTDWLRPYVARRWKMTAFKIAADGPAKAISTSAVRMTFSTDRPFYPYREPADQRDTAAAQGSPAGRTLRVFFIGPGRFDGAIGEAGSVWPGEPRWSNAFERTQIPARPWPFALPENAWLTDFEDTSSPRPGTDDVLFSPAKDPSPIVPPPVVDAYSLTIPLPLELVVLAGAGAFFLVRARRRKAPAA